MESKNTFSRQTWWETPIVRYEKANADCFNLALEKIIRQKEMEIVRCGKPTPVAGLEDGLTAHWLEYNVFNWDFPECRELCEIAISGFREFVKSAGLEHEPGMEIAGISCWANILRPGQALQAHHHDPAFASAHYTVTTGLNESEMLGPDSGHTVYFRPGFFERSHGGKQNGWVSPWDDNWRISSPPRSGKMIFFPSYVRHEVRSNLGSTDRISIAMDFFVRRQEALIYFGGPRWYVPNGR